MQQISAPPLVLEPLVVGHVPEMYAVLSDPAIYEFENEPPESEEALARRYALLEGRRSKDGSKTWLDWAPHPLCSESVCFGAQGPQLQVIGAAQEAWVRASQQ